MPLTVRMAVPAWISCILLLLVGLPLFVQAHRTDTVNTADQHHRILAPAFTVNTVVTKSSCGEYNGSILIQASGGTAPYTYSLNGSVYQSSAYFPVFGPATYSIGVKDATGTIVTVSVFVDNINSKVNVFHNTYLRPSHCSAEDGSVTLIANGGTPPYMYSINGVDYQASSTFNNLSAGNYYIYAKDANGCIGRFWMPIAANNCTMGLGGSFPESSCNNDASLSVSVIQAYYPPFTYSLDGINYQSTGVFPNLPGGWYTIHIKDGNGTLYLYRYYTRDYCYFRLQAVAVDATCSNQNGTVTANVLYGKAPYQYSIDGINFQAGNTFTGLMPGYYTVVVKDADGYVVTSMVKVNSGCPEITLTATDASCGSNNGTITATGSGGASPYSYSLNGINYQSNPLFTGQAPGTYTVTIKDGNGNTATAQATVGSRCMQVTAAVVNATCNRNNGLITATATNGIAPLQYSLNGSTWQAGNIFTGLAAGAYTVTVKDAGGLTAQAAPVTITSTPGPGITANSTPAACNGNGGTVTVQATGGTAPFLYTINGFNFQNSNLFTNISAGTYTVGIQDANNCTAYTQVQVIVDPTTAPQLAATATSANCLNDNGTITAAVNGGNGPFQYSLTGTSWQAQPTFNKLPSGNYTLQVRDANTCIATTPVIVPFTNNLTVELGNDLTICEGTGIEIPTLTNATDGLMSWTPVAGLNNPAALSPMASPVTTTKYYITVGVGLCQKRDSIIVFVNPAPVAYAGRDSTICAGKSLRLYGSDGISHQWSPATYLDDPLTANPVVNKPAVTTTYYLSVTDANNCRSLKEDAVTVFVTPPAVVFAGKDTSIIANQPLPLLAQDINKSGFTAYDWSPATGLDNPHIANPVARLFNSITYRVVAATPAGCEGAGAISIKVYKAADIYVPNAFSPNGDGRNELFKAIPIGIRQFQHLVIYNRWGEQVFYTSDPSVGWNGSHKGMQQSGTFIWKAAGIDYLGHTIQRKGVVTVIR